MPAKPSTNKCDKHNSMVNRHIGTAYDTVKIVADNLDEILAVGDNLDYLLNYLGAYPTHPTERPNGDPLQDGDYYFNTVDNALVYYDLAEDIWFVVNPQEVLDARDEAIAARDAAQAAQVGAETAETNAAASESAAATSEANAALSESNASVSETNAATSESNAATSASNAETSKLGADASAAAAAVSESNAATSETNAATSASEALASENAAESSEIAAANSAVSAAQSAADAEAAFDNFNDMYLGAFAVDPTVDNDGNPLQVGATYWNTVENEQRFWSGAVWDTPSATAEQAANAAIAARDDAQISETNAANSELAAAASATDAATSEANASASELNAATSETNASNSAAAALTSETNAASSETNAATSETNALASENKAEQWAEEAEDTEVEPNKYSAKHWATKAADSAGDVTWKVHTRGEAEIGQMKQDAGKFAASGFVHYGKHINSEEAINEGLYAFTGGGATPNTLFMGRYSAGSPIGESKTEFAVSHIAGFISEVLGVNSSSASSPTWIKFPDAPDGTVIYDSTGNARGSGSTTLDLATDVDPKYGDVAADTNEAVARAFEGTVKDGDFRNGTTEWEATGGATVTVTDGVMTVNANNVSYGGVQQYFDAWLGDWEIGDVLDVEVTLAVIGDAGNIILRETGDQTIHNVSVGGVRTEKFQHTFATKTDVRIQVEALSAGSASFEIHNISVRKATEEVIIDRHDMFGGEFFLEEVTQANPFVYPKGMIQSKATTMNGIATAASARPATYYAVFDGDTGSAGLGVDFWAATDQQKIDMVSDHSNNIFLLADGRVVQWRMRQRTVVGLGNGDWHNLDPTDTDANGGVQWDSNNSRLVLVQGHHDSIPYSQGDSTSWDYFANNANINVPDSVEKSLGVFCNRGRADSAVDDLAFFHVWGVVRRLNQGAYHPSFNPLGARKFREHGVGNRFWYKTEGNIASASDCFYETQSNGEWGLDPLTGFIGATDGGGRDDGRLFDAIYAGGDGGVNDHRLSSWDMSSKEEAAKVFQKVVNGTFRGEEVLGRTLFLEANDPDGSTSTAIWFITESYPEGKDAYAIPAGSHVAGIRDDGTGYYIGQTLGAQNGSSIIFSESVVRSGNKYLVMMDWDSSVSGEFQMVDVIGDPAEILATPDLANGWQGGWIPVIPNGSSQFFQLTRKALSNANSRQWTNNNGDSWLGNSYTDLDTTRNGWNFNLPATQVQVNTYTAFAKQTVEANNEPVLNVREGIGSVWASSNNWKDTGALFGESLLGKVMTSTASTGRADYVVERYTIQANSGVNDGIIDTGAQNPLSHKPLDLDAPNNDSPAVKALWYQTANNQQVSMNFAWNELVYKNNTVESTTGDSTANKAANSVHAITSGRFNGMVVQRNGGNTTGTFDSLGVRDSQGNIYFDAQSMILGAPSYTAFSSNGNWGDDSTISITDGTDTYTNRNGDTCLRGSAMLSKPIGYTKNQARVSTQTEGVDL